MQVKSYISSKIFIAVMDYGHPEVFYFFYHISFIYLYFPIIKYSDSEVIVFCILK